MGSKKIDKLFKNWRKDNKELKGLTHSLHSMMNLVTHEAQVAFLTAPVDKALKDKDQEDARNAISFADWEYGIFRRNSYLQQREFDIAWYEYVYGRGEMDDERQIEQGKVQVEILDLLKELLKQGKWGNS